jgi:rare lipoprotein A
MNARLIRKFGIVLSGFTLASCAVQPSPMDSASLTSPGSKGLSTNRAQVALGTAGTATQNKRGVVPAGICLRLTDQGSEACRPSPSDVGAVAAAAASSDALAADDELASDDSADNVVNDGALAHAEPIAGDTPDVSNFHQSGKASWYGRAFHGRRTASGERYDMHEFTAAHRSLPLLSYVRVTNLFNHHSVIVKITDRGPFHGSRILDLSMAAAKAIGLQASGTGRVSITGLSPKQASVELRTPLLASR